MKRNLMKTMIYLTIILFILWSTILITDYIRCGSLKEPIFVMEFEIIDDIGSGIYKGLGYTVEVRKHNNIEYGIMLESVTMKIFGKVISASIT